MGFEKYPFRDRTSEKEDTGNLFVEPEQYEMLLDAFKDNQTCFISGNRGTGKTIIIEDLKSRADQSRLVVTITHFSKVALSDNLMDFYDLILQEITKSLLIFLKKDYRGFKRLSYDDKVMMSFLLMKYGESITDSQLKKQIEEIQLSSAQRAFNKISRPLTWVFNYFGTTATNFGNQFLTKTFGMDLPQINCDEVLKIFPDVVFRVVDDFKSVDISYSLLSDFLERIVGIVGSPIVIFFDKFDEDSRIENDSEVLIEFLKELVADNALLLNGNIQLMISIWRIAFKGLSSVFRRSKHYVYDISWSKEYLTNVLEHRLQFFSNDLIVRWEDIFSGDVEGIDDVLELSNGNPRDLWDVFDKIIRAQYELDATSRKITKDAIKRGMDRFVSEFNFFEYYPRRKNARKNTNDVYSYIKLLLFLHGTDEFTNAELREAATTGGAVTNHITNMQTIGLVEKTDQKRSGGSVIYRILDPKVRYAIDNEIDIVH